MRTLLAYLLVPAYDSGRRLCLLFEAGVTRYAVDATSIVEVAVPAPAEGRVAGGIELKDLSQLLGGKAEVRPGAAVVLDVSPTLAIRIRCVQEVSDVAQAPHFLLPPALTALFGGRVSGALLHKGRLYLELGNLESVDESAEAARPALPARTSQPKSLTAPPDRALIFESDERFYGIALPLVSQVVNATEAFCLVPADNGPVTGLFPHAQSLWPIYRVGALLGTVPRSSGVPSPPEPLFVLTELVGQSVGFCASRVLGIRDRFEVGEREGEFRVPGVGGEVTFPDLQHEFS